jgi:hypothetical protein
MRSEMIGRMFGAALGAALIIAGLAAFEPRIANLHNANTQHPVAFVLHASEVVNVTAN